VAWSGREKPPPNRTFGYPKVRFGVKQAGDILQAKTALYGPLQRFSQFLSLAATGQG
jgi:hypothetical protein